MYFVSILAEDDKDQIFYHEALEKMTGENFQFDLSKLRKGEGISGVRKMLPIFLNQFKQYEKTTEVFFIVAIDNDRSPIHPLHEKRANLPAKGCRYCEIEQTIKDKLGENRKNWPVQGAIVVPVEMLESWLLLISNDQFSREEELPIFASKSQTTAKRYYKNSPPAQLKDLVKNRIKELQKSESSVDSMGTFCIYCGSQLNPESLATKSLSFAQFKAQVEDWKFQ